MSAQCCDRIFYVSVFEKGYYSLQCTLKLIRISAVIYSDISFKILILIFESDAHVKLEFARGVRPLFRVIVIHCGLSGRCVEDCYDVLFFFFFFQEY